MKREKLYTYVGENGILTTVIAIPGATSIEKLRLQADEGKILKNKKTGVTTEVVVIRPSDAGDWEEITAGDKSI